MMKKLLTGATIGDILPFMSPKDKKIAELAIEAKRVMEMLESAKPLYNRLDELTIALKGNEEILPAYGLQMIDNYSEKNTVWRAHGIKRFELKKIETVGLVITKKTYK